ncbi:MAG: kelch repeat-containing protein, partial [Candidatus Hermodarchaeota archaeon]
MPRNTDRSWTQLFMVGIALLLLVSLFSSTSLTSAKLLPGYVPVWVNMNPATSPGFRHTMPLSYDSTEDRVILFGGWSGQNGAYNDTWAYNFNTNTWTNRSPTIAPQERTGHGLAYDNESDRTILFSGWRSGSHGTIVNWVDTWVYDYSANTWTNMSPVVTPTGRLAHFMAYDSESDRVILFGGLLDGAIYNDETWAYDYNSNNWTQMSPSQHPSARMDAPMTYDSESDRVILHGGSSSAGVRYDTWAYDYNTDTWEQTTLQGPTAGGQLTYDSASDLVVYYGGTLDFGETMLVSETWTYDFNNNTWTQMLPLSSPPARSRPYIAYDSESDVIILYGGLIAGPQEPGFEDTWAYFYTLPPPPIWLYILA